jgi:UDP-glucose 4-epimerase
MSYTLVIGGTGFIGKHVCDLLISENKKVIIAGRSITPYTGYNNECVYVSTSKNKIQDLIKEGIEIIDLSYSTTPGVNSTDIITDLFTNVKFSLDVFEEAIKKNIKKIIIVSSGGTVYGNQNKIPIKEDTNQEPISSYGIIKSVIERCGFMFYNNYNLPITIVRPSNAYGEGQRKNTGQGFITAILSAISTGEEINVYGGEEIVRDYIHVKDVAAGIIAALKSGINGEVYNISTGIGTSNIEVIHKLKKAISFNNKITISPKRAFDVNVNVLDNTKLCRDTGWVPTVSLDSGIKGVVENFNLG